SADPKKDPNAEKYERLTYIQMLQEGLQVMDSTASSFCMDNDIPLVVFSIMEEGNIKRAVQVEEIGTIITKETRGVNSMADVIKETKSKMNKTIESFSRDLAGIRTGHANANLLDRVNVEYYGVPTPIQQLAGISVPEARLLVVQPYDKSSVEDVLKAI